MGRRILIAGWATLFLFPVAGWFILRFFDESPIETMIRSTSGLLWQIVFGAVAGTVLGLLAKGIVTRPFMNRIEDKYAKVIGGLRLSPAKIIFLSFCAGFGEELLFRGAVQPLLGIWPTAILFVALHGYLSPFSWRITLYGLYMTLAIALLGYMTELSGIWSACVAHMAIDVVLFYHLKEKGENLLAQRLQPIPHNDAGETETMASGSITDSLSEP